MQHYTQHATLPGRRRESDLLPEDLAAATWIVFLRGHVAQAGGALAHIHHGGTV